jgi:hypothetical protein
MPQIRNRLFRKCRWKVSAPYSGHYSKLLGACVAYFSTLQKEAVRSSEKSLTFTGLHGVTFQKTVLFKISTVLIFFILVKFTSIFCLYHERMLYKDYYLLGCDTVWSEVSLAIRRIIRRHILDLEDSMP